MLLAPPPSKQQHSVEEQFSGVEPETKHEFSYIVAIGMSFLAAIPAYWLFDGLFDGLLDWLM